MRKINLRASADKTIDAQNESSNVKICRSTKWDYLCMPVDEIPQAETLEIDSLSALIHSVRQSILALGHSQGTIHNYDYYGFGIIYRYCSERGESKYSETVIDGLINEIRSKYENHTVNRTIYQCVRKTAALLEEYHTTGIITWGRIPNHNARNPQGQYAEILKRYCHYFAASGKFAQGSMQTARSAAQVFLLELEDMGCADVNEMTLKTVNTCVSRLAERNKGGVKTLLWGIKVLLSFMHEERITKEDLTIAIPQLVAPRRVIREGFTDAEIDLLLNGIDRQLAAGKRDYAIMMTALQTGLRATDVAKLKRQDIDWRLYEIKIVQSKTNQPLSLSLEIETGNAIADYLLNARPKSDLPFVFLSDNSPYRALKHRSVSAIITRRIKQAGVDSSPDLRRGFHSFRRTFGVGLLDAEISVDRVGEMLGQKRLNSVKPYLATHEKNLKECALGLDFIEKAGDSQ